MPLPWDTLPRAGRPTSSNLATFATAPDAVFANREASPDKHDIVIVGAGLAGCWAARTLAEQGVAVCVLDQHSEAAGGASGNPAGIVKPYVTRSPCLAMTFHVLAHRFLLNQLERWTLTGDAEFQPCGVLQLTQRPYPQHSAYRLLSSQGASDRLGLPVNTHAIDFENSGWLNPHALCHSLLNHELIYKRFSEKVHSIKRVTDGRHERWALSISKNIAVHAKRVIIACGDACHLIPEAQHLPLIPARGQISRFALMPNTPYPNTVVNGKHYVIPANGSVWVGATFDRYRTNAEVCDHDHTQNLAGLQNMMPELHVKAAPLEGSAGIRATTPDRLPIVGPMPDFALAAQHYSDIQHGKAYTRYPTLPVTDGLYIIGGLGSRGIVTAPLCAHLLAGILTGLSDETCEWEEWAPLINPIRFLIRNLKKGVGIAEHVP